MEQLAQSASHRPQAQCWYRPALRAPQVADDNNLAPLGTQISQRWQASPHTEVIMNRPILSKWYIVICPQQYGFVCHICLLDCLLVKRHDSHPFLIV